MNPKLLLKFRCAFLGGNKFGFTEQPTHETVEAIERIFGGKICTLLISSEQLLLALDKAHFEESLQEKNAKMAMLAILERATNLRASDLHFETRGEECVARVRIDGVLTDLVKFENELFFSLVNLIKLESGVDISQKLTPQDGRFGVEFGGRAYDLRLSTLPTIAGESVVVRILQKSRELLGLGELGFSGGALEKARRVAKRPGGMVLLCGPTGSGKTTTLYALLAEILDTSRKFISVEDPVEYEMAGVSQVALNEKAGMTFKAALRAILRQDPDVILVGEVRDEETLLIAVRAALTGHKVFSTLHTNSAILAISRMVEMGAQRYLLGGAMSGIISQRLVRRLCPFCKEQSGVVWRPKGCEKCFGTGYFGRVAVAEILEVTHELASLISNGASEDELSSVALKQGFVPLKKVCEEFLERGETSEEEVAKVVELEERG